MVRVRAIGTGLAEMWQSVVRRFDPAGLGLAVAVLSATWVEHYVAPGTATVETRLNVIVGLGLPLMLILVAADSLWRRWRGAPDADSPMDGHDE